MKITILFLLLLIVSSYSQSIYEMTPGTENNKIILSLSNISINANAENIRIHLTKGSPNLSFDKQEVTVKKVKAGEETDVYFSFDVKREVSSGESDTVEFLITDNKSVSVTKQFILKYALPEEYIMEQNFPNPFNPSTTIRYQLPFDSRITLKVYDILGNEVATLINGVQQAGYKEVVFEASTISSGVYIYRLTAENLTDRKQTFISTKKMIAVK